MDALIGFGIIGGLFALFFVADFVWSLRMKKKLQSDPSKRPPSAAHNPAGNSTANYGAAQAFGQHGPPDSHFGGA